IRVQSAEPVDSADLIGHTSVGARAVAWSTTPEPAPGTEWAGATELTGYFTYWDPATGELPPYSLRVAGGVLDLVRHASSDFTGPLFDPLSVGEPRSVH